MCLCMPILCVPVYYRFPQGLDDVSKYPALISELISRGWTEKELAGVLRLNFIRVFRKVEKVRKRLFNSDGPVIVNISWNQHYI